MVFTPASTNFNPGDFTAGEKTLFIRIFTETLDKKIPELLHDIWDDYIKAHPLPKMYGATHLRLYETNLTGSTLLEVGEFANYTKLKSLIIEDVITATETLAEGAAASYAWNVRNAYLKGGRPHKGYSGYIDRLHVTDWDKEFHVNIVKNSQSIDLCAGEEFLGWVAYRYRFAAAKF